MLPLHVIVEGFRRVNGGSAVIAITAFQKEQPHFSRHLFTFDKILLLGKFGSHLWVLRRVSRMLKSRL